jgi:hypothetical protein
MPRDNRRQGRFPDGGPAAANRGRSGEKVAGLTRETSLLLCRIRRRDFATGREHESCAQSLLREMAPDGILMRPDDS